MKYKLKRKKGIGKSIKGNLIRRTKKAFSLTRKEKKQIKSLKKNLKSKLPTKKKILKLGKRIDFRRLGYNI